METLGTLYNAVLAIQKDCSEAKTEAKATREIVENIRRELVDRIEKVEERMDTEENRKWIVAAVVVPIATGLSALAHKLGF